MPELDEDIQIPDNLDGLTGPRSRKVVVHFTDDKTAQFDAITQLGVLQDGCLALVDAQAELRALVHPDEWKFAEFVD